MYGICQMIEYLISLVLQVYCGASVIRPTPCDTIGISVCQIVYSSSVGFHLSQCHDVHLLNNTIGQQTSPANDAHNTRIQYASKPCLARFLPARRYASAVLAVVLCPSIRVSARPSQTGTAPKWLNSTGGSKGANTAMAPAFMVLEAWPLPPKRQQDHRDQPVFSLASLVII